LFPFHFPLQRGCLFRHKMNFGGLPHLCLLLIGMYQCSFSCLATGEIFLLFLVRHVASRSYCGFSIIAMDFLRFYHFWLTRHSSVVDHMICKNQTRWFLTDPIESRDLIDGCVLPLNHFVLTLSFPAERTLWSQDFMPLFPSPPPPLLFPPFSLVCFDA
jgi:hypothetical protein